MTSFDPMTREELLELAPLDALGHLDDFEAALFDRSFHHAPASVQAEIIALQADVAAEIARVVPEQPRALLKSKVLLRVAEEVEETAEQLKPLAQIGIGAGVGVGSGLPAAASSPALGDARWRASDLRSAGPIGTSLAGALPGDADPSAQDDAMRELVAEIRARSAVTAPDRTTPYWRAAAFFLAAGLLVSVYFLGRTIRTADAIAQLATARAVSDRLAEQVPGLGAFFARDALVRGMSSDVHDANVAGTLYIDRGSDRGLLVLFRGSGVEPARYRLQAIVEEREEIAQEILVFDVKDPVTGVGFTLPPTLHNCRVELIAINSDGSERRVLTTA